MQSGTRSAYPADAVIITINPITHALASASSTEEHHRESKGQTASHASYPALDAVAITFHTVMTLTPSASLVEEQRINAENKKKSDQATPLQLPY
jgi:hypothetical protein